MNAYLPAFRQYNFLTEAIPEPPKHPLAVWLLRLAFIGFVASIVSDSVSNSLRVIKTYRQVNDTKVSYCKYPELGSPCPLCVLLMAISRGCEVGGCARRHHWTPRPWSQDPYLVQWPSRTPVLHPVEAFLGPVSSQPSRTAMTELTKLFAFGSRRRTSLSGLPLFAFVSTGGYLCMAGVCYSIASP